MNEADTPSTKRYLRLTFEYQLGAIVPNGPPADYVAEQLPQFAVPNELRLTPNHTQIKLKPVERCIYCGAKEFEPGTGRRLSDEHVVSEGLGARLVLAESSCAKCNASTRAAEGSVLRTLLYAARRKLQIRSKKRRRDNAGFDIQIPGIDAPVHLPLELHPTTLFLPVLNAPGILVGWPTRGPGVQGVWALELNNPTQMINDVSPTFATPTLDTVRFCQMLAKIGHAFAVAQLGTAGFIPLLPEFIRKDFKKNDKYPECFHLIGGDPTDFAETEGALHVLGWGASLVGKEYYLVVAIRLFANLGAPAYWVVVGKPTDSSRFSFAPLATTNRKSKDRRNRRLHFGDIILPPLSWNPRGRCLSRQTTKAEKLAFIRVRIPRGRSLVQKVAPGALDAR